MSSQTSSYTIIITALPVEFNAVIEHLQNIHEVEHPAGTIYEVGNFSSENQDWNIAVIQAGMGNPRTAFETERAINFFNPSLVIFVGVAGGLKDVNLGDVVAATKVYGFEYGKAEQQFKTRAEFGESTYSLIQRALAVSRRDNWLNRIQGIQALNNPPRAFVGAIAAGEKIVASTNSQSYKLLKINFSDALAVEMEGFGFFRAIHANHHVEALMIRGISDMIDNKSKADASGSQEIASCHAAAFAFEVLAKLKKNVNTTNELTNQNHSGILIEQKASDNAKQFGQANGNIYFGCTEKKIRDNILDQTRIIEDKTQEFVGRQFVFDAINKFIETNSRGYFIVRGDPGIGKSALAAQLVKTKACVHHFNIRAEGISKASNFMTNICAQLIAAYDLDYKTLPPDTTQDSGFLSKLLGEISDKLGSDKKLIMVVDALDEVDNTDTTSGANVLYLPMTVPAGIYIVATMRRDKAVKLRIECEQKYFDIKQDDDKNLADISKYIASTSEREGIQTYISKQDIDNKAFISILTETSQGNFIYLYYVLPEIERGAYTNLALTAIPVGLKNYYEDHWGRMRAQDEEAWFKYKLPVIVALTVVKAPISIDLILDFSKVPKKYRIRAVLQEWWQFLYELQVTYQGGLQKRYRMYHASFHDFLAEKEEIADEFVDLKAAHEQIANTLWDDLFDE